MTGSPVKKKAPAQKKSGIRSFKPGEVIFRENDPAQSLFIIQKGQIRLYRPKGRGFVDLAILRNGEVIGEMAYFDEKARRRSCSAAAIVTTEVIEISFAAFEKTMAGLNPWFKTIINTLADRLRKTNERVKSLESNSVGFGQGGKVSDYKFFHSTDIIRTLSLLYLTFKTHGEQIEKGYKLHMNTLKFYLYDVFNVPEVKFEEFLPLLIQEKYVELDKDEDGLPKIVKVKNIDVFRSMFMFFNTQRLTEDEKKIKISDRGEKLLQGIVNQLVKNGVTEDKAKVDISAVIDDLKGSDPPVSDEDLKDAIKCKMADDIVVGENNRLFSTINYVLVKKVFPSIRLSNAIDRVNKKKAGES